MSHSSRAKTTRLRRAFAAAAVTPLLAIAACGDGGSDALDSGSGEGGEVVIAHQQYTEMEIMAEMYAALLEDAGFDPTLQGVETRDLYIEPLGNGEVDVVPDYASSMTETLNREINGAEVDPVSSPDVDETITQLEEFGSEKGVTPLEPAEAENANAYAVTSEFSEQNDVTSLSDLGELGEPIALAAAPDCPDRPDCQLGLKSVYDIEVANFEPLGFGTVQTKEALESGEVELGQVGTSDGSLESLDLVVLEDDKDWQNAENLTPVVNSDFLADNPEVEEALNKLSDALTTEDLMSLNAQVDVERLLAEDVATDYLENEGLLG
ncbi:MAG TPA: ABC transporter substrate-binding protein [Nocardioidaceae bacterium]|nr:ABC transporter substrate-binding protein [Nocardioidaceae bacterium]